MTHVIASSWEAKRKHLKHLMNRWRKKTGNWHFWLGNMTISRSATGQTFLHMENTKALPRVNKCHVLRSGVLGDRSDNDQRVFFTSPLMAGKVKEGFAYLLSNRSLSSQQGKAGPALGPETDNMYTCSTQRHTARSSNTFLQAISLYFRLTEEKPESTSGQRMWQRDFFIWFCTEHRFACSVKSEWLDGIAKSHPHTKEKSVQKGNLQTVWQQP